MNRIYKIEYCIKMAVIISLIAFTKVNIVSAQSKIGNKYGLSVTNSIKILPDSPSFDLLDIPFAELKKMTKKAKR